MSVCELCGWSSTAFLSADGWNMRHLASQDTFLSIADVLFDWFSVFVSHASTALFANIRAHSLNKSRLQLSKRVNKLQEIEPKFGLYAGFVWNTLVYI